jgi:hypothetical protein
MLRREHGLWLVGILGGLSAAQATTACGDSFGSCQDSRTCVPKSNEGGAAGEGSPVSDQGGAADAGASSEGAQGGVAVADGGSSIGGGGGESALPECADGYSDWLTSSFAFPDGDVIGTADFPSMPWAKSGNLKIDTGRLSGAGAAIVSQGTAFPYAGSRLRFRTRFTDSNQQVTAAFDAAKDGSGGVRIEVDGSGRLSLAEGKTTIAFADLAPLDAGIDWFIEGHFEATSATIQLSRKNYASEKQAEIVATIDSDALKASASGTKAVIALASSGGTSPSVDEVSFARCGAEPPAYTEQLVDTFERADSTVVGHAEVPATSVWTTSSASERIVSGALLSEGLKSSTIPLKVSTAGLRIRTAVEIVEAANAYLWADVNYNVAAGEHGSTDPGFWVWGGPSDGFLVLDTFGGVGQGVEAPVNVTAGVTYYVELNRDDDIAVLTLRSQSFTGPILGIQSDTGVSSVDSAGDHFTLGDEGGGGTLFHEVRVENYQVP